MVFDDGVARAGNISVPPAPAPTLTCRLDHGGDHVRMLAHAEIIVGTRDGDVLDRAVDTASAGERETVDVPLQMSEDAATTFVPQTGAGRLEKIADTPWKKPRIF
ncbi:hypothetical protein WOC76_01175 [Methylocystis sp. IM3]|uniref:hypothetical protein n=1 Tax=unclassified Methylocystis TaxID=2625913 RepID=UPI0030FC199B